MLFHCDLLRMNIFLTLMLVFQVIHPALNVLVNLVCPPPSISNKPSVAAQGQQPVSVQTWNGPSENREKHYERNNSDNVAAFAVQNETRERNAEPGSSSNTPAPAISAGVVGDRRISLGSGYGSAGLAAQLEQGYHQAREAVRANNGIKILLHLLNPRMITPAAALDCIRALACRVLLGLARDESIAHILTNLQVVNLLYEIYFVVLEIRIHALDAPLICLKIHPSLAEF